MKRSTWFGSVLMVLAFGLAGQANAGLFWDTAGSAGSWIDDGTTTNWGTSSGGPYHASAWVAASDAVFEGTAGAVTVSGTIASVKSITFATDGYTLSSGTITMTGAGGNITTGAGTDTIGSVLVGTVGLTQLGAGTLTLGGTNTLTGTVTINNGGTLKIASGGKLANGTHGRIGYVANAINNSAIVSGGQWDVSGAYFQVGYAAGANNNSLTVSDGGQATCWRAYLGYAGNSNSNAVTISGGGSLLTVTGYIRAGNGSSGNSLLVQNGGIINVQGAGVDIGQYGTGCTNNSITVTGGGSVFTDANGLNFGCGTNATGNFLLVSGGGKVASYGTGNVFGNIGNGAGANGNYATITGAGSVWDFAGGTGGVNRNALTVGNNATASDNAVNVSSGGAVANISTMTLGGIRSTFNLGDGGTLSTASVQTISMTSLDGSGRVKFNNGRLTALAAGALVSGAGHVQLNGPAYVYTDLTSSIDSVIDGTAVGTLIKEGIGTLTLSQANTYLGDTQVDAGTLSISNAYLADASAVKIATSAFMDLNFTGIDTVGAVWLGGSNMGGGTFNAATQPTYFTGGGSLYVVPEPATMAFVVLGGVGLLARRRRRA
ncbi:MAG: autotransporter-associated beta strand repeat-containing protein [Planctomycetota bacterium]|nr:autotransporter-associated beta strand repeat-containing protein [Planctomycetota bacterium]